MDFDTSSFHVIFISNFSFYRLSHLSFVITILSFHELLGSSELVSHHAQELLTLLKYIQVNQ